MTEASLAAIGSVRELMSSAPFDTVATVLERRAHRDRSTAPLLLAAASWCAVIRDDIGEARRLAAQAVGVVRSSIDSAHLSPIVIGLADVIDAMGGARPFDPSALDRIAELFLTETHDAAGRLRSELAWMLEVPNWFTFADRYDDASRMLDGRLADLDPAPDVYERVSVWCCLAELEFRRGRWDSARQSSLAAIDAAMEMGDDAGYAHALAARIEAGRGHPANCDEHVRTAWALSIKRGDRSTQWRVVGAEAFAAASTADWTRVRGLLGPLVERGETAGVRLASIRLWDGDYLESLVRLDERAEARRCLDLLAAENAAVPTRWTSGLIERISALTTSEPTTAIGRAEESVATFESIGAVFEAARSRLVLAELLHRARETDAAVAVLRSASLTFGSLGATAWLDRVELVGSSGLPADDAVPVPECFAVLTRQEVEVALSVIHGATNKEASARLFVSVKTIETHLTRIFRKLQVRSRAELVATYYSGIRRS